MDEEISAKVIDFLDRNDPKKTGKPFFVGYNTARLHVVTVLSPKYEAMLGVRGGKDWGTNEAGISATSSRSSRIWVSSTTLSSSLRLTAPKR